MRVFLTILLVFALFVNRSTRILKEKPMGKLLKVTSTHLTKVEISLKRIFMVELSVRRLS